jgi:hypothetical protein
MNVFEFEAGHYRQELNDVLHDLQLSLQAGSSAEDQRALQMIAALEQAIDIMQRANAAHITPAETSEIADYAFNLLDELANLAGHRGMPHAMLRLHKLSLPVCHWLHAHGGQIKKLDIVVNAIASHANTLGTAHELETFCELVTQVVTNVDADIKRDLDNTDPMRPWRVLNLNWGIIATRSHNTALMRQVFDQLLKNIPLDAPRFFQEGMQQMVIINYPQTVREVMEQYYRQWSGSERKH